MASRREQKERAREERERKEAAASSSQRRRRLVGYGAGGAVVLVLAIVGIVLLAGGGGSAGGSDSSDVLPSGGSYPEPRENVELEAAVEAAGCELESHRATSREHVGDLSEEIEYESSPPTSGSHYQQPAEDAAYEDPPDVKELVHTLEHGRVIIWFDPDLPAEQRASLKAYYDDDTYQTVLVPDMTGMRYAIAATAWNRDPQPNGTGRLLGCPRYNDDIFTALEVFKDENRGIGPEPVP